MREKCMNIRGSFLSSNISVCRLILYGLSVVSNGVVMIFWPSHEFWKL